jgi:hypothetical protein
MAEPLPKSDKMSFGAGIAIVVLCCLVGGGAPMLWDTLFNKDDDWTPPTLITPPVTSYYAPPVGDLDCKDFTGPVYIGPGPDLYGLDADHDGVGCE